MAKHERSIFTEMRWLFWALAVAALLALIARLLKDRLGVWMGEGEEEANAWAPAVPESHREAAAPVSYFPGGFNVPPDSTVETQRPVEPPAGERMTGLEAEVAPLVPASEAALEPAGKAAAPGEPDDLKVIEGIGPKTDGVLREAGITTFRQLAETSVERLEEIVRAAGLNLARPRTWPEQAALAAEGRQQELRSLKDQIVGGEKVEGDE